MAPGGQSGNRKRERGGSKLNMLITLLVVGAIGFAVVKIVPPYFANYEFQDAIQTEAKFALTGYPKRNQSDIQDEVFKKAQDLGLPVKRDEIHVVMDTGHVSISLDYLVPIDLSVYQFTLHFTPHSDNTSI